MSCLTSRMLAFVSLAVAPLLAGAVTPIPDYAIKYAPYSYLSPGESYWPSDITTHLQHVFPSVNGQAVATSTTLANLSSYPSNTFLTSKDNVLSVDQPQTAWVVSAYGTPNGNGLSAAPATIIAVNKPSGIVDVFYFLFYSFNLGNTYVRSLVSSPFSQPHPVR
jgi:hypothetical protein